jgi:dTDP-4-amino-4,6-dideoxygalactose transaminase
VSHDPVPFVDLGAQRARIGDEIDQALARVLAHGQFIGGPEIGQLEQALATHSGAAHCVSCASGTDALVLVLMAAGIGPGDAVFVPSFTFAATAEAVALVGAVPVFVDVDRDTFNIDPDGLAVAHDSLQGDLRPRAVIAVDLYGQPADYARLEPVCRERGLELYCDAAQSFGARAGDRAVGTIGTATTTSFYPAKPLGAYGEGGAVFTEDEGLALRLRSLRSHGQGDHRYEHIAIGLNGRLDTMQAAVLLAKLAIFRDELGARQRVADRYAELLGPDVATPKLSAGMTSTWAQYTILCENRDEVVTALQSGGIATAVHYPIPLNRQKAYSSYPCGPGGTPVAEWLSDRVLSLPMHAYLDEAAQARVAEAVLAASPVRPRPAG